MYVLGNILFWMHFMGLGIAVGCGVALSRIGPKLMGAEREQFWPLFTFLSRMAASGLVVLLVTGPLMIWLKFGGVSAFNGWFWAKMNFVGLTFAGFGLQEWARARFARGDAAAGGLMALGGRITGIAAAAAVFCAVFAFN